eukprot:g1818.t1
MSITTDATIDNTMSLDKAIAKFMTASAGGRKSSDPHGGADSLSNTELEVILTAAISAGGEYLAAKNNKAATSITFSKDLIQIANPETWSMVDILPINPVLKAIGRNMHVILEGRRLAIYQHLSNIGIAAAGTPTSPIEGASTGDSIPIASRVTPHPCAVLKLFKALEATSNQELRQKLNSFEARAWTAATLTSFEPSAILTGAKAFAESVVLMSKDEIELAIILKTVFGHPSYEAIRSRVRREEMRLSDDKNNGGAYANAHVLSALLFMEGVPNPYTMSPSDPNADVSSDILNGTGPTGIRVGGKEKTIEIGICDLHHVRRLTAGRSGSALTYKIDEGTRLVTMARSDKIAVATMTATLNKGDIESATTTARKHPHVTFSFSKLVKSTHDAIKLEDNNNGEGGVTATTLKRLVLEYSDKVCLKRRVNKITTVSDMPTSTKGDLDAHLNDMGRQAEINKKLEGENRKLKRALAKCTDDPSPATKSGDNKPTDRQSPAASKTQRTNSACLICKSLGASDREGKPLIHRMGRCRNRDLVKAINASRKKEGKKPLYIDLEDESKSIVWDGITSGKFEGTYEAKKELGLLRKRTADAEPEDEQQQTKRRMTLQNLVKKDPPSSAPSALRTSPSGPRRTTPGGIPLRSYTVQSMNNKDEVSDNPSHDESGKLATDECDDESKNNGPAPCEPSPTGFDAYQAIEEMISKETPFEEACDKLKRTRKYLADGATRGSLEKDEAELFRDCCFLKEASSERAVAMLVEFRDRIANGQEDGISELEVAAVASSVTGMEITDASDDRTEPTEESKGGDDM